MLHFIALRVSVAEKKWNGWFRGAFPEVQESTRGKIMAVIAGFGRGGAESYVYNK